MGTGSSALQKAKTSGNSLFVQGHYAQAADVYTRILSQDPLNHLILSNRCACFVKLRKLRLAYLDAVKCVESAPTWDKAYYRLGTVYEALGIHTEALACYRIAYSPNEAAAEAVKRVQGRDKGTCSVYE